MKPNLTSLPRWQAPLNEAGGDLTELMTPTRKEPDRESCSTRERNHMTTINQYLLHRSAAIPQGLRTGAAVVAAGVSTGVSIYLLAALVGSWA
jgi:hypothetical protein